MCLDDQGVAAGDGFDEELEHGPGPSQLVASGLGVRGGRSGVGHSGIGIEASGGVRLRCGAVR